MSVVTKPTDPYDIEADAQNCIVIQNARFKSYQVEELTDGRIVLKPKGTGETFRMSKRAYEMLESSLDNLKKGVVSEKIVIPKFDDNDEDLID